MESVPEAVRLGFLSPVPSDSGEHQTRFTITDDAHDFLLFCAGSETFEGLLEGAREDDRFNILFKQIDAGGP